MSAERAGGVDRVSVRYDFDNNMTSVTDALGTTRHYTYELAFGVARTVRAEKPSSGGGIATSSWSYDAQGNIATYIDYRGHRTDFIYDLTRNLEIHRTEGAGTSLQRTITTEWHPTFRLPKTITEPNRVISFDYDPDGNLTHHTVTAGGKSRTWSFQYYDNGQIKQIDGPRTDVRDLTTYAYDGQGNLMSRTDALGHLTQIPEYDADGRPKRMVDPNGLITTLEYDPRGRLVARQVGRERTTYMYDGVGQLRRLTRPDGSFWRFDYDAAHRWTGITDHLGNTVTYSLDAVGNTTEQVYDPQGILRRTQSRLLDALNRLGHSVGARGQTTSYAYDDNDNLTGMTTPFRNSALWSYDALDRLDTSTDLRNFLTGYDYDANDQLTAVTDPLRHQTVYGYDGLGDQTGTTSPDTGLTQYLPDEARNVVRRTDARGQETTSRYDALNRVTDIEFSGGAVAFTYDQGTNGIGRLTQMTDPTGTTSWMYDAHGRVLRKTQQVANVTFVTQYSYDASGRVDAITYPSGQRIELLYTNGQITQINANGSALLRDIHYQPFGPARAWIWGNGTPYAREFDLDGRVMAYDLGGGRTRQLTYDDAGRITDYTDTDPRQNQAFSYDAAGALTGFTSGGATTTYHLDAIGNRTSLISPQGTDDYTYDPASNRLLRITGPHPRTYQYDAAGHVTSDGATQFVYDGRGRLILVTNAQGTTQYRINGLGQRVAKVSGQTGRYFVYNETGQLIGEYTLQGQPVQETVYLGEMPVAVLQDGMSFVVYADHLGTPRAIADTGGEVVWRWDGDPFGAALPNEDPDGDGRTFTYHLRFPGQYFDRETGLAYNYFRDYDPQTGRYVQADPLGLAGGLNPYRYVEGNPLTAYDPYGLAGLDGGAMSTESIGDRQGYPPGVVINPATGEPIYLAVVPLPKGTSPTQVMLDVAGLINPLMMIESAIARIPMLLNQVRLLRQFGLDKAATRALFQGEVAPFFASTAGNPLAFAQLSSAGLRTGIIGIRAEGQGVRAFMSFIEASRGVARAFEFSQVEIAGVALINPELALGMIRSGFRPFVLEVPATLGGGTVEGLIRTFPLRRSE